MRLEGIDSTGKETGEKSFLSLEKGAKRLGQDHSKEKYKTFSVAGSRHLETLEGSPLEVDEEFNASRCNSLTNLKGAPRKVGKFVVSECEGLTSLAGSPDECLVYDATDCPLLKNLKGVTQDLESLWVAGCTGLVSLEGCPQILKNIDVTRCEKLKTLAGGPRRVRELRAEASGLENFKGGPIECSGVVANSSAELRSLEGLPNVLGGSLSLVDCLALKSLDHGPSIVEGNVDLSGTGITSLEGIGTKSFKAIHGRLVLPHDIKSHILGVLCIEGLTELVLSGTKFASTKAAGIIMSHFKSRKAESRSDRLIDCQHELIEAGFEDLAQL